MSAEVAAAPPARPTPRALAALAAISLVIGAADGLVFLGFEWVVNHGSDWIWNDLVGSDQARWRVVPLALVLSISFTALLRLVGQARWVAPHLDPLGAAESPDEEAAAPALRALGVILLVGAGSLLAGASLGPEAPLVGFSAGLGAWVAARATPGPAGRLLVLSSAGALLVAFFGSLACLAIPLLILFQRTRRLPLAAVVSVVIAGVAAWGMLWLIQGSANGFGQIPPATVQARDYLAALVLSVVAVGIGGLLRRFVIELSAVTKRIDAAANWWVAAALFGLVVGLLYLLGGETVQFSGSEGSVLLIGRADEYSALALAGIALVKLLVTGWSLGAGYRGGLVFPSVFAAIAVSLFAAAAVPAVAGPGIMLGAIVGLLVEMTAPVLGIVVLFALVPLKLVPLGLVAAAGAMGGRALLDRLGAGAQGRARAGRMRRA